MIEIKLESFKLNTLFFDFALLNKIIIHYIHSSPFLHAFEITRSTKESNLSFFAQFIRSNTNFKLFLLFKKNSLFVFVVHVATKIKKN